MTTDAKCAPTNHRFAKFDDATIFCERCGEQRVMDVHALVAALPTITYIPCPHSHWQTYPMWQSPTYYPVIYSDSTTSTAELTSWNPLDD